LFLHPNYSSKVIHEKTIPSASFFLFLHVNFRLGLTHDGDQAAGNDCIQDAVAGSVMAPMVSATFHRFSWSACSKKEFHMKAA
jgi:hypothetical protein